MLNALLGVKSKTSEEKAKEWKLKLQAESRSMDRQIRKIQQQSKRL